MTRMKVSRPPARVSGFRARPGLTCEERSIDPRGWSTGPRNGRSRSIRNPRPLEVELDPGLELLSIQGSGVSGYRILPESGSRRVVVTLGGELKRATELKFLAHARVPVTGRWQIPAIRPLNATWTGGATTVTLDDFHVVEECIEKAGRRVFGAGADSEGINQLVFQAESPRSVAEIEFRKPRSESSCLVRGHLFVSASPCRLECQLDLTADQGLTDVEIELSPGWNADRMLMPGLEVPLDWHAGTLASGTTLVQVAVPPGAQLRKELTLILHANAARPGARGSLDLPRVRARGSRIVDEAWLAWADSRTMVRPTQARGLAWIDPGQIPGLLSSREPNSNLRESLAWRWTALDAVARVDREPIEQELGASIRINAIVDSVNSRLTLDGTMTIVAGAEALDSIPIWLSTAPDSKSSLVFEDPDGGRLADPAPIDQASHAATGLPAEGQALRLAVALVSRAERVVHFRGEYPWTSAGEIPILAVPQKYLQQGVIAVKTPATARPHYKATGLRVLDVTALRSTNLEPARSTVSPGRDDREPAMRMETHAFAWSAPGGRLEFSSEPLFPSEVPGVVREAVLTTAIDPSSSALHRLRLLVHCAEARSLDLTLPEDTTVARVRRDGTDVAPIISGTGLKIPLLGVSQGSRLSTIVVEYVRSGKSLSSGGRIRPDLPAISFPCLSFVWDLVVPSGFEAVDHGPGLVALEDDESEGRPGYGFDLWNRAWEYLRGKGSRAADGAAVVSSLDERLAESTGDELTFAEWFTRWDSGPRPVIVDRVSLNRVGYGPKSACSPVRAPAKRRGISLETLDQYGLGLVVFPNALLITTTAELPRFDDQARWATLIAEALLWGADQGDRFQGLPRWRGETSPRTTAQTAMKLSSD